MLLLLLIFAFAAPASAAPWDQPTRLPHPPVTVHHAVCPDWGRSALGCADAATVWVMPGIGYYWARTTWLHELGHVVDLAHSVAWRLRVQQRMRWREWDAEKFADVWMRTEMSGKGRLRHVLKRPGWWTSAVTVQ